jgi:hypothetical protein
MNRGGYQGGNRPRGKYIDDEAGDNVITRRERDEMELKLLKVAEENLARARKEKDNTQQVRLWLNQISPDNYAKKEKELRGLIFGDAKCLGEAGFVEETAKEFKIDEQKQQVVVQTIFRKAQSEHAYAGFYADLVTKIIRLELTMRGMKATVTNLKHSQFRANMLTYCRESFETFLQAPLVTSKQADEKEEDRLDREIKTKEKLFGNIEFVGELFKEHIVTEAIFNSVFSSLLGIN